MPLVLITAIRPQRQNEHPDRPNEARDRSQGSNRLNAPRAVLLQDATCVNDETRPQAGAHERETKNELHHIRSMPHGSHGV